LSPNFFFKSRARVPYSWIAHERHPPRPSFKIHRQAGSTDRATQNSLQSKNFKLKLFEKKKLQSKTQVKRTNKVRKRS
jgi:hypothetical protein